MIVNENIHSFTGNNQCVQTRFSIHEEGVVREKLTRFQTLLTWYLNALAEERLKNIEEKWWKRMITSYRVVQFSRLIDRCYHLWKRITDIDHYTGAVSLDNVHLVEMSHRIPHLRIMPYWGKSEIEQSILQWKSIEECLEKTLLSLR